MSSAIGVQVRYLRRANCTPKRTLYSRVSTSNVGDVPGQKGGHVGKGAGAAVGIFDVPKYWPPSTISPIQLVIFRPNEASHPGNPAQCPALNRPASAYVPPTNNSSR